MTPNKIQASGFFILCARRKFLHYCVLRTSWGINVRGKLGEQKMVELV